jgi:hypothetical protein
MTAGAGVSGDARTLADPLAESLRVVEVATSRGLLVRLMGGMAIRAHAPDWTARTRRTEVDLDFVTTSRDRTAFYKLLEAEGYMPDKQHNALFGGKQGYFFDVARKRPVDVLVDTLEMCHRLDFAKRLEKSQPTLPLADLLLTKLQVVKINRKDVLDALVLLAEHPLGQDDGDRDSATGLGSISIPRIVEITSNDWGWWRTVTGNLDKLVQYLEVELQEGDLDVGRSVRFDPAPQVRTLRAAIDAAPKSARWRLRARVGDRVAWYNEPEEVGHAL